MGKSQEEIAFEMLSKLKGLGVWGEGNKDEILDLFAECLIASKGLRRVKGLESMQPAASTPTAFTPNAVAAQPTVQPVAAAVHQAPAAPRTAPLAAPVQAAQAQAMQAQHAPAHNPVHQQQQQVAQTFAPPQNVQRQG